MEISIKKNSHNEYAYKVRDVFTMYLNKPLIDDLCNYEADEDPIFKEIREGQTEIKNNNQ